MKTTEIQALRDNCKYKVQHGDVIIRRVELKSPPVLVPVEGNIVSHSAHPHHVDGGELLTDPETKTMFLRVEKKATFLHQHSNKKLRHKDITVDAGLYFIEPSVEVDFLSDMVRPVAD